MIEVTHPTFTAAYSDTGAADISTASLYGSNLTSSTGNSLVVDGWSGEKTSVVYNFNDICFRNIVWNTGGTVLNITDNTPSGALSGTGIHLESVTFAGGTVISKGDTMTFLSGTDLGVDESNVTVADTFTAGVAIVGTGEAVVDAAWKTVRCRPSARLVEKND